jgi:hypothetical protein
MASAKYTEKEEIRMKITNRRSAPRRKPNMKHIYLTSIHLLVLMLAAFTEPFFTTRESARALP